MKQLTEGERIARDLCEAEPPIDNIIEVDPVDAARRIDTCFAELRAQLAAAQKEIELLTERNATNEEYAANLVKALTKTQDQLAKAEQRVGEWQPIETAPKDGRELILLLTPSKWPQVAYSNTWWTSGFSVENKPTNWMPLPKAPNGASS